MSAFGGCKTLSIISIKLVSKIEHLLFLTDDGSGNGYINQKKLESRCQLEGITKLISPHLLSQTVINLKFKSKG